MRPKGAEKHARTGEKLTIAAVDAGEQEQRIHAAVARRAYEIFERRGSGSHEQEDWRLAESELARPLCFGQIAARENLWLGTDAAPFQEGTINIWVAPRRLTICGKPHVTRRTAAPVKNNSHPEQEIIFRVADLPIEVDPSRVTAKLNGQSLEILLKMAEVKPEYGTKAAAA